MDSTTDIAPAPRVLLLDADEALAGLLHEWLGETGCVVQQGRSDGGIPGLPGGAGFDLAIVDIPFLRQRGVERIRRIAASQPALPIIVLSSGFFTGVEAQGPVARTLGVASVLPKPASRQALIAAVQRVLPRLRP